MKITITSVPNELVITTVSYRGYTYSSFMLSRRDAWAWVKEACESLARQGPGIARDCVRVGMGKRGDGMSRFRPFSNGTQYLDWETSNCSRCTKTLERHDGYFICSIEAALNAAMFDDGTISESIAKRMGYLNNRDAYSWPCGEVEWTAEWQAEYEARGTVLGDQG